MFFNINLVILIPLLFCFASTGKAMQKESVLKKVRLEADISALSENEKKALNKMIEASRYLDDIYLKQVWSGNIALRDKLQKDTTQEGKHLFFLFTQNKGPWLRLENNKAFIKGVPANKPIGAGFYPEDMSKEEFTNWLSTLTESERQKASGFFTVIERTSKNGLRATAFSEAYRAQLEPAAKLLKEASNLTSQKSLQKYLTLRSEAFLSDSYYDSDVAWMELDSIIEPTIGPYETYEDGLFNYKAAFESFITIKNSEETEALKKFSSYMQEIENNLPIDEKYKNPKVGALAPIRVVDQVFSAGEARRGIATAAFNLPNDEKVIKEKGSKRVMLKNVQKAKFDHVLVPISKLALTPVAQKELAFEPFFTHILMHEIVHGLGPHDGVRIQLKDLYSAIEEAKADITGLFALKYLINKKVISQTMSRSMYSTFLASCFRSVRFGIHEAHGRGIALQFNYLRDKGAFVLSPKGTFSVDFDKIDRAVSDLAREILTIQAEKSYEKAKVFLDKYAVIRPEMKAILDKLANVPVDIQPYYPIAGETDL